MNEKSLRVPPPMMLGCVLLFWGWMIKHLWLAVPMAVVLELHRYLSLRFEFGTPVIRKVLLVVVVATAVMFIWMLRISVADAVMQTLSWLPLISLPLLLAQLYRREGVFHLQELSFSGSLPDRPTDLRYPYILMVLLACATAVLSNRFYFYVSSGFVIWILWALTERHRHNLAFVSSLTIALLIGFGVHNGLSALQNQLINFMSAQIQNQWQKPNTYRTRTAIGHIGRLKFSERILMRVNFGDNERAHPSVLLQQASYNRYTFGSWRADDDRFSSVTAELDNASWKLSDHPNDQGDRSIEIMTSTDEDALILPIPAGTTQIKHLRAQSVQQNQYNALRAEGIAPIIKYQAIYFAHEQQSSQVTEADLEIPDHYKNLLMRHVALIGMNELTPQQKVARLSEHFREHFRYSLVGREDDYTSLPLASFLESDRKGHCEYFATASALLLRAAGIPTRYAVGFGIGEYSVIEGMYVVRHRHAHAWTLAYVDGAWQIVDNTPSEWATMENAKAPWWQPFYDLASHASSRFKHWLHIEGRPVPVWLLAGVIFLLTFYLWRWLKGLRVKRFDFEKQLGAYPSGAVRTDDIVTPVLSRLSALGEERSANESIRAWCARLAEQHDALIDDNCMRIVDYNQRYRYDPTGLTDDELQNYRACVTQWLTQQSEMN